MSLFGSIVQRFLLFKKKVILEWRPYRAKYSSQKGPRGKKCSRQHIDKGYGSRKKGLKKGGKKEREKEITTNYGAEKGRTVETETGGWSTEERRQENSRKETKRTVLMHQRDCDRSKVTAA